MNKPDKKIKELNIIMIVYTIVILYSLYSSLRRQDYLSREYSFTVAKTIKYEFNKGWKNCIKYKYYVNNKKFEGCLTIDSEKKCSIGKFYKVRFSKIKPDISEIYVNEEIIDSAEISNAGFDFKK
ncbi:hypothetical protein [Flavobacterium sedimenticola]|uniref:DUF3301 domain-containing protein n=1 Tax=Flavobacterium sedimenticola TaxID=3043286 RepID=A0ABT6XPJ4_9FLAO|nr:hypothetical protein [Flavobacterium sedimenticola]MDI9256757.1 hypothetical protein [Flavobacterium sedimenticola]